MKTFMLSIIGFVTVAFACWSLTHRYEFRVSAAAPLLYRCDNWTGHVSVCVGMDGWQQIADKKDIFDQVAAGK
jgi:hypothetical protein